MYRIFAILLLLAGCTNAVDPSPKANVVAAVECRPIFHGSINENACAYEVADLAGIDPGERIAVMVYGMLGTAGNRIVMRPAEAVPAPVVVIKVKGDELRPQDIAAMLGKRGRAVGYYTAFSDPEARGAIGSIETHSLGTVSAGVVPSDQ